MNADEFYEWMAGELLWLREGPEPPEGQIRVLLMFNGDEPDEVRVRRILTHESARGEDDHR